MHTTYIYPILAEYVRPQRDLFFQVSWPEPEIANLSWAIPEKIQTGGLRIYSFENPSGISNFLTLHLEIPDKTKLNPWIFHKIVLDPLDILKPKTKTPGNSTLFFLGHPWKFHFLFN